MPLRCIRFLILVSLTVLGAYTVSGQDYPSKPVRMVTSEPGGGNDFAARLMTPSLSGFLSQPVIVENRGGMIPMGIVSKAAPDGYTLLLAGPTFWIAPLLQKTAFDPVRDFAPIILTTRQPNLIVVHPSLPVKSVKDLIALAKANPGQLNCASGSVGGSAHLALELFNSMAHVNIVRISYTGAGLAVNALVAGQMQLMFATAGTGMTHVKSGRLRALAVTSAVPSALAPGLPTVAASGLPGYESAAFVGVFAPAGTSDLIINRLNREILRVLDRADVKEKYFNTGSDVVGSSPGELGATMASEMARLGKVIKDVGIKAD